MESGDVQLAPVLPRHFAVDERGVGLRATWHPEHGFVNVSLWSEDRCVQTFRLTPVEAGRFVGFLAGVLGEAVPAPRPRLAAVPALPEGEGAVVADRPSDRLGTLRRQLSAALDEAARRIRP